MNAALARVVAVTLALLAVTSAVLGAWSMSSEPSIVMFMDGLSRLAGTVLLGAALVFAWSSWMLYRRPDH